MKKSCAWCGGLDNDNIHNTGLLLLRLVLGFFMLAHGIQKINNFQFLSAGFPDPFHIGSSASLVLIIFAEFGCSLLIIIGLFTRLATIPLIIGMFVASFVVHAGSTFEVKELAVLYLSLYVVLSILGAGKFSLDYVYGIFCGKYCKSCKPEKIKTQSFEILAGDDL